jgi:hypothetical protein
MVKITGHYFCDKCDEIAYGEICRGCQRRARWVKHPRPARPTVDDETAREKFAAMFAAAK